MKSYIVYIAFAAFGGEYSLNNVLEEDLSIIIDAYKNGDADFTLSGTNHRFLTPKIFGIYEILNHKEFAVYVRKYSRNLKMDGFVKIKGGKLILLPRLLDSSDLTKSVTKDFIGNMTYGELKTNKSKPSDYVSQTRINELSQISNTTYDLTKVIQFCKELNDNWHTENYLSVGTLIRALKDHVPPIFGCSNFNEVANNYNGNGKSFKQSMKNLQSTSKNISDRLIHSHITNSVSLPSETQVNFSQDIDAMLEEILRVLK